MPDNDEAVRAITKPCTPHRDALTIDPRDAAENYRFNGPAELKSTGAETAPRTTQPRPKNADLPLADNHRSKFEKSLDSISKFPSTYSFR